jgi:hypothetical protein
MARVAYAAAHVVSDALETGAPWRSARIDMEATLRFRRHLWELGFGIAEVMDTAQRGMGLDWEGAKEVVRNTMAEARLHEGAQVACGVGTDQLADGVHSLEAIVGAYEEQLDFIEDAGATPVLMASRALVARNATPDEYARAYERLVTGSRGKVILHWLGEMFDPALAGYWGYADHREAMDFVVDFIQAHAGKIEGIKISLLDKSKEVLLRRRLPGSVKMFTGDDFNYPELIAGDEQGYSHALLGIFDPIAPAAAAALVALEDGDRERYFAIMNPTLPLARLIFETPTQYYKAGVVFLAWLNGHQDHFGMLGGMQSARSVAHYAELFRLADQACLFRDPDLAADRMTSFLRVSGIGA